MTVNGYCNPGLRIFWSQHPLERRYVLNFAEDKTLSNHGPWAKVSYRFGLRSNHDKLMRVRPGQTTMGCWNWHGESAVHENCPWDALIQDTVYSMANSSHFKGECCFIKTLCDFKAYCSEHTLYFFYGSEDWVLREWQCSPEIELGIYKCMHHLCISSMSMWKQDTATVIGPCKCGLTWCKLNQKLYCKL